MKVNISIDDVSPHPRSSIKVLDRCNELISVFPDIKFTLFVPMAYWRTVKPGTQTNSPLVLKNHPEFCDSIKRLPKENFEICYHGLHHGIPGVNDNDEFHRMTYDEAFNAFQLIEIITNACSLNAVFKPVFRPPAWRMSSDAIKAAKYFGIRTLALSSKKYAKDTYQGEDEKFGSVVYYDCAPPFEELKYRQKNEIVYHACEWDKNYLNMEMKDTLVRWLKDCKETVEFVFIEGLA